MNIFNEIYKYLKSEWYNLKENHKIKLITLILIMLFFPITIPLAIVCFLTTIFIGLFPGKIKYDKSIYKNITNKQKTEAYTPLEDDETIKRKGKWTLLDVYENRYKSNKVKKFYLELKDDGKYYEAENAENFGKLKKRYSSYDFLDRIVSYEYRRNFNFFGYSIYKMKDRKNIESEFISDILFYNATETGIEFITPYGCGFFDFNTESMSLVPKEKYIGKEFIYTIYYRNGSWKYKEKRKVITEADFILPDIKIPLSTDDLDLY